MAAYAHGFVVSIIGPHGNIRESSDVGERVARLPYESEYKIRLKNKNHLRSKVQVLVDGTDISPGRMFILEANQTVDLERFLQDGDLDKGSKFKFVNAAKGAVTGEIQDPFSNSLGLVEVRFYREIIPSYPTITSTLYSLGLGGSVGIKSNGGAGGAGGQSYGSAGAGGVNHAYASNCTNASMNTANSTPTMSGVTGIAGAAIPDLPQDKGGTAMGAESGQKFGDYWQWFNTEFTPVVISVRLKGLKQAVQPVVQSTPQPTVTVTNVSDPEYHARQILLLTEQRDKAVEYLSWALSLVDEDFKAGGNIGFAEVIVWKAAKGFCAELGKTA